jgi:outer membrane beta-barrel protein
MKRHGNSVMKVLVVLMAALWLSVVAASWSEAAEGDGEYNFSWLDPDKKVSVLQNRKYTKANRVLLGVNFGFADTNAYLKSYAIDPRLAYYFSESWGIEVFYSIFSNKKNASYEALESTGSSARPDVIEPKNQMGVLLHWAPWYAKINVFNTVLYFDWYFTGGVGTMSAEMIPGAASATAGIAGGTKSMTAFYLGTGHLFHVSEHFDIRLDYRSAFYKAPQRAVTGKEIYFNNSTFQIGLGFRL